MLCERFCWLKCFPLNIFSQVTVLNTVTIPQVKLYHLFLRKFFRFIYQFISNSLDLVWSKNLRICLTERKKLFPFLIELEIIHPEYYHVFQTNTEKFSQLEFSPEMITRAISAIGNFDLNILRNYVQFDQQSGKKTLKNQHKTLPLILNSNIINFC